MRFGWGAALVAGALLRLLFYWLRPAVAGDALMYGDLAHNLLAHHAYGFSGTGAAAGVHPTLIRLPGYPLFLAACFWATGGVHYAAALWVQMLVDLAGCALLGKLAERVGGERAGLRTVWLAALCPFTANYSVVALAESISVFCVIAAFFALEAWRAQTCARRDSWGWAAAIGCALSAAVLLRPDQGLLAVAVLPVMLWVGRRCAGTQLFPAASPALVAALLVALPLAVWTARNWRVFHVVQPLAPRYANDPDEAVPFGFQRWFRTWAIDYKATVDIYWAYDDTRMSTADLPARAFDSAQEKEQTQALFARYNKIVSATPELDAAFAQIAAQRIAEHPVRYYVELPLARELDMWLRPRLVLTAMPVDWWAFRRHPMQSAEELASALLNAVYLALAVLGLLRWYRCRWNGRAPLAFAMLTFVALRCVLLLTLDNSEPRYTLECFPVVIFLAGLTLLPRAASE